MRSCEALLVVILLTGCPANTTRSAAVDGSASPATRRGATGRAQSGKRHRGTSRDTSDSTCALTTAAPGEEPSVLTLRPGVVEWLDSHVVLVGTSRAPDGTTDRVYYRL